MYNNYWLLDNTSCFAITRNLWYTLFFFVWFKCSATSNVHNDWSHQGKGYFSPNPGHIYRVRFVVFFGQHFSDSRVTFWCFPSHASPSFFVGDITSLETLVTVPIAVWIKDPYVEECHLVFGPKPPLTRNCHLCLLFVVQKFHQLTIVLSSTNALGRQPG